MLTFFITIISKIYLNRAVFLKLTKIIAQENVRMLKTSEVHIKRHNSERNHKLIFLLFYTNIRVKINLCNFDFDKFQLTNKRDQTAKN